MKTALITLLLIVCCFAAAVVAEPRLASLPIYQRHSGKPLEVLLGDSRKLFAGRALAKSDAYFHSGMYPTIFDRGGSVNTTHIGADAGALEDKNTYDAGAFLGEPRDVIDRFSRSFFPSEHKHLDQQQPGKDGRGGAGGIGEILPWLQLSAELDPNNTQSYVVSAYWLRTRLGKVKEAEDFLRTGLEHNPNSYAILFELGRIYLENKHDFVRARNILEAALSRWKEQNRDAKDPDTFLLSQIAWHLATVELETAQKEKAISYMEIAKSVSPKPEQVEERIAQVRNGAIKSLLKKVEHDDHSNHDDHDHAHCDHEH